MPPEVLKEVASTAVQCCNSSSVLCLFLCCMCVFGYHVLWWDAQVLAIGSRGPDEDSKTHTPSLNYPAPSIDTMLLAWDQVVPRRIAPLGIVGSFPGCLSPKPCSHWTVRSVAPMPTFGPGFTGKSVARKLCRGDSFSSGNYEIMQYTILKRSDRVS